MFERSAARVQAIRGGLGRRILVWFLVLSLLPLLVSNSIGYAVSKRIIEGHVHRYLRALGETQVDHVAHALERHRIYLEVIASSDSSLIAALESLSSSTGAVGGPDSAVDSARLRQDLEGLATNLESISGLSLLDAAGWLVGTTRAKTPRSDFSDAGFFQAAHAGEFFVGEWSAGVGDRPAFLLATPIRYDGGRQTGVLTATVDPALQPTFLNMEEHVAEHVETFIVCAGGRPLFVSHEHGPIDYGTRLPSPLIDLPAGSLATYINYAGEEVIGVSLPIRDLPWRYIAEEPTASALGQLQGLRMLSASLEALFALLLVAVVWLVAGSIVQPLRELAAAAQRIRGGDLTAEVRVGRADEVGELAETFNQMAKGLRESADEIHDLHQQEMRRASQLASVGELAAGVAHEIKNPLAGAESGIDLLEHTLEEGLSTDRILAQVREQLRRIDRAVRDLLSYARPTEPKAGRVDPDLLVERVLTLVRPQAEAAGITLERGPGQPNVDVRVDPELITQALVNLALNGIQAMERDGTLTIDLEETGDEIRIAVRDTGSGLSEDRLKHIFRPFYTTKHRGTGLGLAITRSIAERHGGRIEVESTPGRGSRFTLVLRRGEEESAA
jgi:signal transduction histidine kinase